MLEGFLLYFLVFSMVPARDCSPAFHTRTTIPCTLYLRVQRVPTEEMRPRPQSAAFIPLHTVTRLPPLNLRSTLPSYATLSSSTQSHTEPDSPPNAAFDFSPEKHLGVNRNLDHDQPEYPDPNPNDPNDHDKGKKKVDISDREWELRTGMCTFRSHR